MGQLLESAWNLDEKCRFKVLPLGNEKPPCNPPVFEEQETDVPGSLGLSRFHFMQSFTNNSEEERIVSHNPLPHGIS